MSLMPRFKAGDLLRVKITAPFALWPGERVRVTSIDKIGSGSPLVMTGQPAGWWYSCDVLLRSGEESVIFASEEQLELE